MHSYIESNAFFIRFSCDTGVYRILENISVNVVFHTRPHTPQTLNKGYLTYKRPSETSTMSKDTIHRVLTYGEGIFKEKG